MEQSLVSYCIISYNQEHCIREALESAITQDYENMEIIVSDDNSKDNTFGVIKDFVANYKGQFKFILNRNPQNLFIVGNLNKAIELSSGKYIVFAAGDDKKSDSESIRTFVEHIKHMNVLSLTSNANIIDGDSIRQGTLFPESKNNEIFEVKDYLKGHVKSCGAARIIDRKLLEIFGMLNDTCPTEDSTTNFRAILTGGLGYVSIPLIDYRVDGNNVSIGSSIFEKFDPLNIYNQYLKDLNTAKNKGLIDSTNFRLIKRHIDNYLQREIGKRLIYRKKGVFMKLWTVLKLTISFKYSFKDLYCLSKCAIALNLKKY